MRKETEPEKRSIGRIGGATPEFSSFEDYLMLISDEELIKMTEDFEEYFK